MEEAAAPAALAAVGLVLAGEQDDEAGQVGALAAQAVRQPGAEAGPADDLVAGVHEDLGRRVVELRGVHRAQDGDVVGDRPQVRQQLGDLGAGLAVAGEAVGRAEQARRAPDECEPLALEDVLGGVGAVELRELRLVVEQIDLGRRASHE